MSRYLLVFVLVPLSMVVCDQLDGKVSNQEEDKNSNHFEGKLSDQFQGKKFKDDYYEYEQFNPDDLDKFQRPCAVYDQNCIRKFFEEHAHCKKVVGKIPDTVVRPQVNYELPRINVSMIIIDMIVTPSNVRIEEFYIDKATDKLVISIEYRNITLATDSLYLKIHRRAKEPVVTVAPGSVYFSSFVVTAVIPKINDLQLERAECTIFSNDLAILPLLTPSLAASTDPQVPITGVAIFENVPVDTQEFFLTDAAFFATLFIQYTICDFGLYVP